MTETEKNVLFATIWLWGNLGAVGNRARRGFGSPVIYSEGEKDNPFNFQIDDIEIKLPISKEQFDSPNELEDHLKHGLIDVWKVYKRWISNSSISTVDENIDKLSAPINEQFFILQSFDQITVGNSGFLKRDDAIKEVHGRRNCDDLGCAKGNKRMASPVFIRFHKVNIEGSEQFLPIFTWCKQEDFNDRNNCAKNYLTSIQNNTSKVFTKTLGGSSL